MVLSFQTLHFDTFCGLGAKLSELFDNVTSPYQIQFQTDLICSFLTGFVGKSERVV